MFVVAIKDLEIKLSNLNLLTKKIAICFKLLAQKREIDKQTVIALDDKNY